MKTIRLTFTRVLILTLLLPLAARARVILYFDLLPAGATDAELYAGTANQQGGIAYGGFGDHAGIWSGTPGSFVDLNPPGVTHSRILAVSGNQQAGDATLGFGFAHAGVWSGTAASFVDLDPTGNTGSSTALALSGSQQAGAANFGTSHAGIWSGTAASFVDLHPAGASSSLAYATVGSQQAGYFRLGNEYRACIWSNTASSFVDLNPSGSTYSVAYATSGGQQAGVANYSGSPHAAIWAGTKLSFVNLRPAGADDSLAYATTGARQAGEATFSGNSHAAFWSGTAASFVDLHSVLSNTFYVSHARSIWTNNSAVFIAGYANTTSPHHNHPILWIVFPFNSQLTAGTNTPIPGGSGNFTNFPAAPSLSGSNSTFYGAGAGGQQGIYAKISGAVTKIADTTTAIPGGTGNFTTFTPPNPITPPSPIISGDNVAFRASGSGGQSGVYLKAPNDPCKLVADLNTAIPNGSGNFIAFTPPSPITPTFEIIRTPSE